MELNLCSIVVEEMTKMGFKDTSIKVVTGSNNFMLAYDKEISIQRTYLTMMFHGLFMNGKSGDVVPRQIRVALNIATGSEGWLDDIKLVILPFLKENEDMFF